MADSLPTRQQDFNEWYNQLVLRADMADYAPVRGCMIVKPYGWALWENIQGALDRRFKATGHVNAAFPLKRARPALQGHRPRERRVSLVHPEVVPREGKAARRGLRARAGRGHDRRRRGAHRAVDR